MGKYFTVEIKPDIVNGDISNIQDADTSDLDVGASDLIFDWTAVDMPKGCSKLVSVTAIVNAENGAYAAGSLTDYELIFAKSINGVAPTSLGAVNAVTTIKISCNVSINRRTELWWSTISDRFRSSKWNKRWL